MLHFLPSKKLPTYNAPCFWSIATSTVLARSGRVPGARLLCRGLALPRLALLLGCLSRKEQAAGAWESPLAPFLPQGLLPLSWGCGQEPRHAGSGPNHLHMSLLGRRVLGNLRLSYTFWAPKESASVCAGLKTPARGIGSLVLSVWR